MSQPLKFVPPAFKKMQAQLKMLGLIEETGAAPSVTALGDDYTLDLLAALKRGSRPPCPVQWCKARSSQHRIAA